MVNEIRALLPFAIGAIVVLFLAGSVSILFSRTRYRFVSGRVRGVVGELGGGKSMFVVSRVLAPAARTLNRRRGMWCQDSGRQVRQIITNFTFQPEVLGYHDVKVVQLAPAAGVSLWQQIIAQGELVPDPDTGEMELRIDAVVCIDEMSLFAPSDAMKLDPLAKSFLIMARKWNCEVWWMAQDALMVHKRVRRLSQRLWSCGPAKGLAAFIPLRTFSATCHKPDVAGDLSGPSTDRALYFGRKKVWRSYRSFETIAASAEDLAAINAAMEAAGLRAGESRKNDLGAKVTPPAPRPTITNVTNLAGIRGTRLPVRQNANGPHPQISTPESATRPSCDDEATA